MRKKISVSRDREHACPDAGSLEYILLSASHDRQLLQSFERHFLTCSLCQQRINELVVFYGILEQELQKPTPVRVKRLAAELFVPVE
jgi:hypothetical protein